MYGCAGSRITRPALRNRRARSSMWFAADYVTHGIVNFAVHVLSEPLSRMIKKLECGQAQQGILNTLDAMTAYTSARHYTRHSRTIENAYPSNSPKHSLGASMAYWLPSLPISIHHLMHASRPRPFVRRAPIHIIPSVPISHCACAQGC
jgi:hypothetical protein